VLAAAVAIAFFFLTWGILRDAGEDTPWITSGIGASIVLGGAAILRELILRRVLDRRGQIAHAGIHPQFHDRRGRNKLTLEQNAAILGHIKQKSNAAKVLGKLSAGHREVFELCSEYIARNEDELKTVSSSSPRLTALLKGRKKAADLHHYHMLQWAEIEATSLTSDANSQVAVSDKIEAASGAIEVIEFALKHYPVEQTLLESRELLRDMTVSIRVSDTVEKAERAAFRGDLREAIDLYRDALFYLGRDSVYTDERRRAAEHINSEIERISLLDGGE
jgi:hypothetical protein